MQHNLSLVHSKTQPILSWHATLRRPAHLKLVVQGPVVEVGMRENAVDPPCDRAEPRDGGLLDGDAAREVLVAVQE